MVVIMELCLIKLKNEKGNVNDDSIWHLNGSGGGPWKYGSEYNCMINAGSVSPRNCESTLVVQLML